MNKGKVIVGMSGGVDSAVAACILQEMGFEVVGVTLRTWEGNNSRCCEIDNARAAAFKLGIKYYPWNLIKEFQNHVVKPFLSEYKEGRTPNPCIECNPLVKWAGLVHIAEVLKADYIATGHYASIVRLQNKRFAVKKAADKKKDQSYMLYRLTQEQLARTIFPLDKLNKDEVKKIAAQKNMAVENQKESQEICFVTEGHYSEYIEEQLGIFPRGNFIDENGKILGEHEGIARYTVGQRKGLKLALGFPAYVKAILPKTNEIVIGEESSLYSKKVLCDRLAFMGIPKIDEPIRALVKTRYHHPGEYAKLEAAEQDKVLITFESPVKSPAPGQSAVFYDDEGCVLGGGRIIYTM